MKYDILGLTGYELEVYRSLLSCGLSSAKELSAHCAVPLTAIYPNLNILESKGLIKKYAGDIAKFQAIKPSLALNKLSKKNIEDMHVAKIALIEELESIPQKDVAQKNPVDLSLGTKASISIWHELATQAKKSIYVAGWRFGSKRSIFKLIHSIKESHKRGIYIKIIVIAKNERITLLAKECKKIKVPIRYLDMDNFSMIIADNKECKLTLKNRSLKDRVNLRINDEDLVKGLADYFLTLWSRAKNL